MYLQAWNIIKDKIGRKDKSEKLMVLKDSSFILQQQLRKETPIKIIALVKTFVTLRF